MKGRFIDLPYIEPGLQHRVFTESGEDSFDCTKSNDLQIIQALRIAEDAVNRAIKEGAEEVTLKYINIPDAEHNPNMEVGRVRVIGYRTTKTN